jgi:hypothetical protein
MVSMRNMAAAAGVLAATIGISRCAKGQEPQVVLRVTSGREFQGTIDRSSTPQQLVLRTARDGVTIRRPIAWQRIERAMIDGAAIDAARLREMAVNAGRGQETRDQQGDETGNRGQGTGRISIRSLAAPSVEPVEPLAAEVPPPQVAMIAFDAYVANWDADVETDGLVVELMPLDSERFLLPVDGTVEIEFFAPQRRIQLDLAPLSGGDTVELVGRWTVTVSPADFARGAARLRLPFAAIHPELNPNWTAWWYGIVHVRLAAPGHGVFDASRDSVRVRPFAPTRDQLEMNTGQRFLPTENLGRRD